jgi:WD40 repeat protein
MTEADFRDYSRSRAILVGTSRYSERSGLTKVTAAWNSLQAIHGMLTGRNCGWPEESIHEFFNAPSAEGAMSKIGPLLREAADVLVFYFVGHGISINDGQDLCLTTSGTLERDLADSTSLKLSTLYSLTSDERHSKTTRIFLLDCCFSGVGVNLGPEDPLEQISASPKADGVFTLTASKAHQWAYFTPGRDGMTYFAKSLTEIVHDGVKNGPAGLTMLHIYDGMEQRFLARDEAMPLRQTPDKKSTSNAHRYVFANNAAARPLLGPVAERPIPPEPAAATSSNAASDTRRGGRPGPAATSVPGATARPRRGIPVMALLASAVAVAAVAATSAYLLRSTGPSTPRTSPVSSASTAATPAIRSVSYRAFTDPDSVNDTAVALSSDGKSLAISDASGGAFLWDIATGGFVAGLYNPNRQAAWDVAFSPTGTTVADCTSTSGKTYVDGSVYLWSVTSTAKPVATFRDPQGAGMGTLAFSPDGKLLAAADNNGSVYLLNASTLTVVRRLQATAPGAGYGIAGLAFSPDGGELAGASNNGSVYAWNTATGALVSGPLYDPSNRDAQGIAFMPGSADDATVAVADTNGSAYLWNLATKQVIRSFPDPAGLQVEGVAFTPDGSALITTSQSGKYNHDAAIRVWNVATGALIYTFHDPDSYGSERLALSRDGRLLAVADDNAHAYLWTLDWLHM